MEDTTVPPTVSIDGPELASPVTSLRSTQRAPKSCVSCSRRKVKCDQKVPCGGCIRRGISTTCMREKVVVRGVAIRAGDAVQGPTYDELRLENEWLRQALREATPSHVPSPATDDQLGLRLPVSKSTNPQSFFPYSEILGETDPPQGSWLSTVAWPSSSSVIVPSRACSDALLAYDRRWNSWVHYAIDYDEFYRHYDIFQQRLAASVPLEQMDPFWISLYYAVLAAALMVMDEENLQALDLPPYDPENLLRQWYNTSIAFLNRADYLRIYDVRTVQIVAVLGICFNNMGDSNLYQALWPTAIRIAQKLGIHECPNRTRPDLDLEWCRRLWWTLIICDWLQVDMHPPCVTPNDFNVPLPAAAPGEGVSVQYHAVLARIAYSYYQFHAAMVSAQGVNPDTFMAIVRRADGNLADIIAMLPPELQPDFATPQSSSNGTTSSPCDNDQPSWQRWHITLILLFFRLLVNISLQKAWATSPTPALRGQRAICLDAARGIINISRQWDQPIARRSRWAFSLYVFAAGNCLLSEIENTDPGERQPEWMDEVLQCVDYLDQFKSRNKVAQRGADVLRKMIYSSADAIGML